MAVIAHSAKRNVAIFIEESDEYVLNQSITCYTNKIIPVVLERNESKAASSKEEKGEYHRSHFCRLVKYGDLSRIDAEIGGVWSESQKKKKKKKKEELAAAAAAKKVEEEGIAKKGKNKINARGKNTARQKTR